MAINPQTGQRMGRQAILTQLKALSKVRVRAVDTDDHIKRLKSESDRGVMILAATLVDDALLTALERTVKCPNRATWDSIFDGDAPLASFSRRITFGAALGLIDKQYTDMINVIRAIRNAAAHAHGEIDFSTLQIRNALGCLAPQGLDDDVETWPQQQLRNYFLIACGYIADKLVGTIEGEDAVLGFFSEPLEPVTTASLLHS